MANDRRRRGSDFDSERTIPSHLRREAPRIATPLAPELRAAPAQVNRRPGSVGVPPIDSPTPVPVPAQLPAPNPVAALPSTSAVPTPVATERSSRTVTPGGPDRNSRGVGAIIERVRDTGDPRRESSDEKPVPATPASVPAAPIVGPVAVPAPVPVPPGPVAVTPSPQAIHAAAILAQPASVLPAPAPMDTVVTRTTMVTSGGLVPELVRVHRLPQPPKLDPRLFMLVEPDSDAAASFRVLRHRLGERTRLQVVLVTSASKGEGKTICAANLALALGEAGRARVLLLETNFRRPALAQLFGIRPPVCFSEQLEYHRAQPSQPWVVAENVSEFLHVAAVAIDAGARPMLDGPSLALCIEQLRGAGYDYIVLDSPPVLGSADVNLIEESVDGILFTMWARRSHGRALRTAIQQIGSAKVLGVTLLGTPKR